MEELSVKEIVRANKANANTFGQFMTERIVRPDDSPGEILSQFLAEERLDGRYAILGDGQTDRPLQEETIIVAPKKRGFTRPDELVGALVGVSVIGTIPIIKDNILTAEIIIVRLTEPDGISPADFVRAEWKSCVETDVYLGMDTWVDYPPGIHTQPEPEPESSPTPEEDEDDEDYW